MAEKQPLEAYFSEEEIPQARKYIEEFHGKLLLSDELGRKDAALLGLYMLCNSKKVSEVDSDEARDFVVGQLGVRSTAYTNGLSELRSTGFVAGYDSLTLTFKGIRKIREMLQGQEIHPEIPSLEPQPDGPPSLESPGSLRDAILQLLLSEWGKQPRSLSEIKDALESNALFYPRTTMGSELVRMTKNGHVRRMKVEGKFKHLPRKTRRK